MQSIQGATIGNDLFRELNECLDTLGLKWDKLTVVTIDGGPNLTWKNDGLLKSMLDKCCEIDHVVDAVTKTVNFIRARALNHRPWRHKLPQQHQDLYGKKGHDIQELSDEDWVAYLDLLGGCDCNHYSDGFHEKVAASLKPSEGQHPYPLTNTKGSQKISRPPPQVLKQVRSRSIQVSLTAGLLLLPQRGPLSTPEEVYSEDSDPLGSTYVCEQTFSVVKFNKSKQRSSITNEQLSAVLCIPTSDIQPDLYALAWSGTLIVFDTHQGVEETSSPDSDIDNISIHSVRMEDIPRINPVLLESPGKNNGRKNANPRANILQHIDTTYRTPDDYILSTPHTNPREHSKLSTVPVTGVTTGMLHGRAQNFGYFPSRTIDKVMDLPPQEKLAKVVDEVKSIKRKQLPGESFDKYWFTLKGMMDEGKLCNHCRDATDRPCS
ncbi:unnamed protein product [Lepeophtheirus salmonis]|uniref:(salmon louse) hypothetical protein n=1 Tax=Lepeophtheirus salmonis TaxID=72036 RepID=A0A7R8CS76_LEPSM|nr:unnamed protein product [Lepeophtheirus salmonis]CAF2912141.1 unnamed protein product [Lepeophtheirus salmonis]